MLHQKFQASAIFTGSELLDAGHVLVTDEAGTVEAIVPATEAGENIQKLNGLLSPGFINCHCHLELSHMRGLIPQHTGLVDFVFKVVTERHHSDLAIQHAITTACDEMSRNGIVAVGDICNNLSTLAQKKTGRLHFYNFIELSGWLPEIASARFDKSLEYYRAFNETAMPSALVPHASYSVSNQLWDLMQPYFMGKTVSIHNQETVFEDELFQRGSGDFIRMYELMKLDTSFFKAPSKSSLQHCLPKLKDAAEIILVHNTFTTETDIQFAQAYADNLSWCICIKANRYIESAVPPIDLLRKNRCSMVIGTDSLASNNSLDVLDELKSIQQSFPHISLAERLQWATANGAKALQLQDQLGSFDPGKKPGVVLITNIINDELSPSSTATRLC